MPYSCMFLVVAACAMLSADTQHACLAYNDLDARLTPQLVGTINVMGALFASTLDWQTNGRQSAAPALHAALVLIGKRVK